MFYGVVLIDTRHNRLSFLIILIKKNFGHNSYLFFFRPPEKNHPTNEKEIYMNHPAIKTPAIPTSPKTPVPIMLKRLIFQIFSLYSQNQQQIIQLFYLMRSSNILFFQFF